ncbi:hypothetical protein AFE_1274 [Acidithiobacillus ferrooxidans ATCC 23270]|uniref:Uncharacterized protein n=2 Tax=Acidithiobacillaceae TaxID=225058 RepID=B7J8V6_ACIF2|nr:hypothetical protein AFE_1274 [Acidithiobacillus ferrooxidans ATCC 23270]
MIYPAPSLRTWGFSLSQARHQRVRKPVWYFSSAFIAASAAFFDRRSTMKSVINTASGRTTIFEDEAGVHVRVALNNGQIWNAAMFTPGKEGDLPKAWGAAIEFARSIMTPETVGGVL